VRIFHYHPDTRAFLGEGEAGESPLEPGAFLIPAHATDQAPPNPGPNQVPVFDGAAWSLVSLPDPPAPPPEPTAEELEAAAWAALRQERDCRLVACDWTQLPDVVERGTLTVDQVVAWKAYRKALCDLPENAVDPLNPPWPAPPV
jgi:hypothetical protein